MLPVSTRATAFWASLPESAGVDQPGRHLRLVSGNSARSLGRTRNRATPGQDNSSQRSILRRIGHRCQGAYSHCRIIPLITYVQTEAGRRTGGANSSTAPGGGGGGGGVPANGGAGGTSSSFPFTGKAGGPGGTGPGAGGGGGGDTSPDQSQCNPSGRRHPRIAPAARSRRRRRRPTTSARPTTTPTVGGPPPAAESVGCLRRYRGSSSHGPTFPTASARNSRWCRPIRRS